ncbi:GNAT family N-acetyltransferase [Streptomyces sp. NPDC094031]|uniref:GNAT family N-acetyltransferase n=1 Tax=Streptomyces sp. NPDC094031 TaxID=3155307 RepID=UPI00333049CC
MEKVVSENSAAFRTFGHLEREACVEGWRTPNSKKRRQAQVREATYQFTHRELITLARGERYDIVEVRERGDFRGRMHIQHDDGQRISTFTELWVPREYRRRGIGTALLQAGEIYARAAGSDRVRLPLHEADASDIGRPRAEGFALTNGYAWKRKVSRRPNYDGLGVKSF